MKRTDIKPGNWYAYAWSPRSRWSGVRTKVYVYGEVNVRYMGSWVVEAGADAEPVIAAV